MSAGELDIILERGGTWRKTLTLYSDDAQSVPIDITGYLFRSKFKTSKDATTAEIDLSIGSGFTILDASLGKVQIEITDEQTAGITAGVKKLVYDIEFEEPGGAPGSAVFKLLRGKAKVLDEITDC